MGFRDSDGLQNPALGKAAYVSTNFVTTAITISAIITGLILYRFL
jgi:hypothetical protein